MKIKEPPILQVRKKDNGVVFDPNGAKRAIVAAGNKLYLWTDNDLWESMTELPKDYLPEIVEKVTLKMQKLPPVMLREAQLFFREVEKKHSSESSILYYYHTEKREYQPYVPPQEVTGTSVDYKIEPEVSDKMKTDGFILVGSIHSHPTFGAFQSGTDTKDEICFEGWHITLGNVPKEIPDIHCRIVISGTSRDVEKEAIIDFFPDTEFPKEWVEKVGKKTFPIITRSAVSQYGNTGGWTKGRGYSTWQNELDYYESRHSGFRQQDNGPVWEEKILIYFFTGPETVMEDECTTEFISSV